jgi:hypothetical protein
MDIRKAIIYLKKEVRNLDRAIDAIELAAAARYEKAIQKSAGRNEAGGPFETLTPCVLFDGRERNSWIQ